MMQSWADHESELAAKDAEALEEQLMRIQNSSDEDREPTR